MVNWPGGRPRRNCRRRKNTGLGITIWTEFGNIRWSNVSRHASIYGCGDALRALLKATAMVIVARQASGGELKGNGVVGLPRPRTTRMACGHRAVVSGHLPGDKRCHFTGGMYMAGLHEQHGSQGHLSPSHHNHQQRRGNGFLEHLVPSMAGWEGASRDQDHTGS